MAVIGSALDGIEFNLTSKTNLFEGVFASAADGFQEYERGLSASIPFAMLDDSLTFSGDRQGIIKTGNTTPFFGAADTVSNILTGDPANPTSANSDPVSASWTFDISGETELGISIHMGAMGDFESSDSFTWSYKIDGGAEQVAFTSAVDEDGSQTYTLEDGDSFTLSDPMLVDGTLLTNNLASFETALIGEGAELELILTATTNGGDEAFIFQNIQILDEFTVEPPPPPPEPELTLISAVQGDGSFSTLEDDIVTIEGIVTADFQDAGINGFFVQEEIADDDGDAATSEGIFVFEGSSDVAVTVGDTVRVTGRVDEQFGKTEIDNITNVEVITDRDATTDPASLVNAVDLAFPLGDLEAFEGMYLDISQELFVTQLFEFERFGTLHLSADDRLAIPTQVAAPGDDANAVAAANNASRIILDDASNGSNPDEFPNYRPDGDVRGGDSIEGLTGVLDYAFGEFRIHSSGEVDFERNNPRDEAPADVGSDFKVAAFNVLNYFTTIDTGSASTGPNGDSPRGAHSEAELARQTGKIVAAIDDLDADILGLVEIENDGGAAAQTLVDAINAETGRSYAVVDAGGFVGNDVITNALIYDTSSVGFDAANVAIFDDIAFTDPLGAGRDLNRPAVAATFEDLSTGGTVTVAVNHLKSKGSLSGDPADEDQGDGQGNNNATRTAAAEALADWLAIDPTGAGESDTLIIGDLNAYAMEDPITALKDAGYTDLAMEFQSAGGVEPYSYRFSGEWGTLDYALANEELFGQVTGATIWHINSDEPSYLDYNDAEQTGDERSFEAKPGNQDDLVDDISPFRASDHDPVLVGLQLTPTGTPVTIDVADGRSPFVNVTDDSGTTAIDLDQNRPSIDLADLVEISAFADEGAARLRIHDGGIGVNELKVDKGSVLREGIDEGEGVRLEFDDVIDVFRAEISLELGTADITDIDISVDAPDAAGVQILTDPSGHVIVDGIANGTLDAIDIAVDAGIGVRVTGMTLFTDDASVGV